MYSFYDFFKLGLSSMGYLDVFSHILFLTALCGIYSIDAWKSVMGYVGVFIAGYLITFFLTTFSYIEIPYLFISYLIPVTIIITAVANFYHKKKPFINKYPSESHRYVLGFAGGLIHGFALREILKLYLISPTDLAFQIIGFNFGVVTGIMIITFFLLLTSFIVTFFIRVNIREWNLLVSGACAGIALYMIANMFNT